MRISTLQRDSSVLQVLVKIVRRYRMNVISRTEAVANATRRGLIQL